METREIARGEWQRFLDEFSKLHQGETATVQVISEDVGAQEAEQALPFVGISAEDTGSEKNTIVIILGTEPDDHVGHRITDPAHLWLKAAGDTTQDSLEIEATDGTKTVLQLESLPLLQ